MASEDIGCCEPAATTWEWLKSVQDTGWSIYITPSMAGKGLGA
jgi:hypothetical protein